MSLTKIETTPSASGQQLAQAPQRGNVVFLPGGAGYADQSFRHGTENEADVSQATLLFKLTELRAIGDTFGELMRSALTQLAEARLRKCLRDGDNLEQLCEDEFLISLASPGDCDNIIQVTRRLMSEASGTYMLDDVQFRVKAAVGINNYSDFENNPDEAIRFARIALRQAEQQNSNLGYHFFSRDLLELQCEQVRMSVEIERALVENRMQLHYQPQYCLPTGKIVAVEALVRMQSENGDLIAPDRFIPIAEDNGLIAPLGHWVIREACRQLRQWRDAGCETLGMAVNVSPRQLTDGQLLNVIDEAIWAEGLKYSDLTLELTEQCIVEQLEEVQCLLEKLHERGVKIAIDDFGTGYSSFSYLSALPVDMIKMDRSFLQAVPADERANRTLSAMTAMADKMQMELIVEGVETTDQQHFLKEIGCPLGQGYHLARPVPASECGELLFA